MYRRMHRRVLSPARQLRQRPSLRARLLPRWGGHRLMCHGTKPSLRHQCSSVGSTNKLYYMIDQSHFKDGWRCASDERHCCTCMQPQAGAASDDRFNIDKDPVSWFYQNQIRSEEEFQKKREHLRHEARTRLDGIFARKGKALHVIDSDDDTNFTVCSDEISAWDSELHSLFSMDSCARSWAAEAKFRAPALSTLMAALACCMAASGHGAWRAGQALQHIHRFWSFIEMGWLPTACLGISSTAAVCAPLVVWAARLKARRMLLAFQLALHVLATCAALLSMLCWVQPSRINDQVMR